MNLAQFSIEKSRITFMVLLTVLMMGIAIYFSLSRDSMPPYTVRVASVVSVFPGASPDRVELLVTDKVEKVSQELPELKEVTSTSRTGLSVVTVTLKDEVKPESTQAVWDRLRRKLDDLEGLPKDVKPQLKDDGIGDVYGIVVGITSNGFTYAEVKEYADDIKDELIKIPEAAKVSLGGLQEERVFVEFDNARLKEYDLSASQLQNFITSTNILSTGGSVTVGDESIILEPTGNFNSIDDIKRMLVPVKGGKQLVELGDITNIRQAYIDPPVQKVRINGLEGVSLHVNLKKNANIIALGNEVDTVLAKWKNNLPVGIELTRVSSLDSYIDNKINDFVVNLMQSIGIVLIVMLLFLGFRTGLIIASLIPIVTITTLMVMGLMSIGLNQVTLAALIMALGMLVDNAIVVAETIMVKMEEGTKAKQAAIEAASELFLPLLISTLTTSAAFLAFYMSPTSMGDIVGPIFVVISIALLSSWLIALTVITLFCYLFLKIEPNSTQKLSLVDRVILKLKQLYQVVILKALNYKKSVLVLIFAVFAVSLYGFKYVEFLFFPDSDRNMVTIDINLAAGTNIESTELVVKKLEKFIATELLVNETRQDGVTDWSAYVGKGPDSYDLGYTQEEADPKYAHILVNTSSFAVNNAMIEKIDQFSFNNITNAEVKVGSLAAGGGGVPVEIKVSGDSPDELANISEEIKAKLLSINGTKNIKDDWGPKSKKFLIEVDQNRAQVAGVSSQDIATSLRTVLDGFQTGEYREEDKSIPIVMRSEAGQQQSLASLETLNIYSQTSGKSVPLLQVANIKPQWQYATIKRLDIARTINVTSELTADGNASQISREITPWLEEAKKSWPDGYTYVFGGDAEKSAESMGSVVKYLPLSAFIIVLLLIIQFNSFRKMTMVVLTIPLGLIGVVTGASTGALIAPFAFLGSDYDATIYQLYATATRDTIYKPKILSGLISGSALSDTTSLKKQIDKHITPALVEAIAQAHQKGRRLFIVTTHFDAMRPMFWDIGYIATHRKKDGVALIRQVMLASASVPVLFPPVPIQWEVNGQQFTELHVDGGMTRSVFAYPSQLNLKALDKQDNIKLDRQFYLIINGNSSLAYAPAPVDVLGIAERTINGLLQHQTHADIERIYHLAQRDNIAFNIIEIPDSFNANDATGFDSTYMNELLEIGKNIGKKADFWHKKPPTLRQ